MPSPISWPIAVLGPFHPYRGGISHHTALLVRTLLPQHPILGVSFSRLYPGFLFPGRTQYDDSGDPLRNNAVETPRCIDSIGPWTWPGAARRVVDFGARLLVVQWWHPFFAPAYASIAAACRRRGVRVIFLCHNVLPHESSRVDGALVRLGLGRADGCIVHSETDRDALQRLFPGMPFELTPLPVFDFFRSGRIDRDSARRELQIDGPVLLFFGLVRPYKGLEVLLRALSIVRRQLPVRLLVVGEFYQDRRPTDALVRELGLEESVRIVDRYVPNEEVEAWFLAADLLVMPYRSATQSAIAQIGLSFERPVLVTRVGGLPEAIEEGRTGFVVPPEDPEAMAVCIHDFFAEQRIESMRQPLQGAARRFSWEEMGRVLHRLAQRLGLPEPETGPTP